MQRWTGQAGLKTRHRKKENKNAIMEINGFQDVLLAHRLASEGKWSLVSYEEPI